MGRDARWWDWAEECGWWWDRRAGRAGGIVGAEPEAEGRREDRKGQFVAEVDAECRAGTRSDDSREEQLGEKQLC